MTIWTFFTFDDLHICWLSSPICCLISIWYYFYSTRMLSSCHRLNADFFLLLNIFCELFFCFVHRLLVLLNICILMFCYCMNRTFFFDRMSISTAYFRHNTNCITPNRVQYRKCCFLFGYWKNVLWQTSEIVAVMLNGICMSTRALVKLHCHLCRAHLVGSISIDNHKLRRM